MVTSLTELRALVATLDIAQLKDVLDGEAVLDEPLQSLRVTLRNLIKNQDPTEDERDLLLLVRDLLCEDPDESPDTRVVMRLCHNFPSIMAEIGKTVLEGGLTELLRRDLTLKGVNINVSTVLVDKREPNGTPVKITLAVTEATAEDVARHAAQHRQRVSSSVH